MIYKKCRPQAFRLFVCLLMLICSACSSKNRDLPELSDVTGTVTLNGEPLADAVISFDPLSASSKSQSRTSTAATDTEGKYSLMYDKETPGAIPGDHLVRISKLDSGANGAGNELLPIRYNEMTTLKATITSEGPNQIDFDLTTK